MISRRTFLGRSVLALSAWVLRGLLPYAAEADETPDPDFVSKTRTGKYEKFYINYWKPLRRIRAESWNLQVDGLCNQPETFTLDKLKSLPVKTQSSRMKCVECWSAKAEWQGFHISELEKIVQPQPEAVGIMFHCADNYIEYLDRESLNKDRSLLAYNMDGEPLSHEHGFPLRVIVPFKYGYKNPKAIMKIEYVAKPISGTWSKIGPYSIDGTILPGYDHPLDNNGTRRKIYGGEIFD